MSIGAPARLRSFVRARPIAITAVACLAVAVPAASSSDPIDIATPTHIVRMSGLTKCIVS